MKHLKLVGLRINFFLILSLGMYRINGSTQLIGIIGDPISHTASPLMHNAAFSKLGLNFVYVPLHIRPGELSRCFDALRTLHFRGINITIPHKESVVPYLDHCDPLARNIGAVNTVVFVEGKTYGYNTDAPGFLLALRQEWNFSVANKSVAIIGAGGTARALAVAMAHGGVKRLGVANRTMANAQQVVSLASSRCEAKSYLLNSVEMRTFFSQCDLVINTTSVGMTLGESPVEDFSWIRPSVRVVDVIYSPVKTTFLAEAEARGAEILNGAGMLAGQGLLAFELFTGTPVEYGFMKQQILLKGL